MPQKFANIMLITAIKLSIMCPGLVMRSHCATTEQQQGQEVLCCGYDLAGIETDNNLIMTTENIKSWEI